MDKFWLEKAKKYIEEHNAFDNVSEMVFSDTSASAIISATVSIGLPSRFISKGITDKGVKNKEEVRFIFSELFPLKAPKILFRDDFPRCFPHINPSEKEVIPCIYEGNLSELLQQSEWMNGILNQLVDWLEKAASNDLINYDQGWEPMRNDDPKGFMVYDLDEIINTYNEKDTKFVIKEINYEERKNIVVTGTLCDIKKTRKAHVIFCITNEIIDQYVPNSITDLSELYKYASSVGIQDLKKTIEENDLKFLDEDKLFVILSVKRPINLIGSDSNIEFVNFIIHKTNHRKKKQRELKRVLPECKVGMLSHISDRSSILLKRLSGTKTIPNESASITLVGCGSLGSKIGIHLARNGNGPFLCIDHDIFLPHNNARHALTLTWAQNKANLLSLSIFSIGKIFAEALNESALIVDYSRSRIIIDTTASLSVRNFLINRSSLPPIISGGLYGNGRYGILLVENKTKTNRLAFIWAHLYYQSLTNESLRKILFSPETKNVQVGQSCSSQTMIADDARISLVAALMSIKIQDVLENGMPNNGEILFTKYDDKFSLTTEVITVPECMVVQSIKKRDWKVLLSKNSYEEMKYLLQNKAPKETGGVLLGTVFLYARTVVITKILPAPPDSIEERNLFVLGTEGLEKSIKELEKKTNGKVTYLGTWHSHPYGGNASQTDNQTYEKLLFVRNYEPTVCLIVTQNEVLLV
jgi:integrative and conjugative element protein (TIGR02256 family)